VSRAVCCSPSSFPASACASPLPLPLSDFARGHSQTLSVAYCTCPRASPSCALPLTPSLPLFLSFDLASSALTAPTITRLPSLPPAPVPAHPLPLLSRARACAPLLSPSFPLSRNRAPSPACTPSFPLLVPCLSLCLPSHTPSPFVTVTPGRTLTQRL
jgi:hypothetical protein